MSSIWTIRRSATDAKLTGLCGGVAQHWGVDPVLVRVGAVLLAFSGGIGIVLYLAGWLLIPRRRRDTSTLDDLPRRLGPEHSEEVAEGGVGRHRDGGLRPDLRHLRVGHALRFRTGRRAGPDLVLRLLQEPRRQGRADRRAAAPESPAVAPRSRRAPPTERAVPLPRPGHALHRGGRGLAAADGGDRAAGRHRDGRYPVAPSRRHPGRTGYPRREPLPLLPLRPPVRRPHRPTRSTPTPRRRPSPIPGSPTLEPSTRRPPSSPPPTRSASTPNRSRAARRAPSRAALGRRPARLVGCGSSSCGARPHTGRARASPTSAAPPSVRRSISGPPCWWSVSPWSPPPGSGGPAASCRSDWCCCWRSCRSPSSTRPNQAGGFERTVALRHAAAFPPGGDQHEFGALTVDLSQLDPDTFRHLPRPRRRGPARGHRPRPEVNVVVSYVVDAGVVVENGEPVRSGTDMTGASNRGRREPAGRR